MATATVDLPYLSNYLSLPQGTLDTLTTSPTTELVQSVLEAVAIRAREHDETKAERLRLDVELENAVRSGDSRTQGLKSTVEKSLKENGDLRTKLQEQGRHRCPESPRPVLIMPSYRECSFGARIRTSEPQVIFIDLHFRAPVTTISRLVARGVQPRHRLAAREQVHRT